MLENSKGPVAVKDYPPIIRKIELTVMTMMTIVFVIIGIAIQVFGIWWFADCISLGYSIAYSISFSFFCIGMGVLIVMMFFGCFSMIFFKYEILAEGIRTKYPLQGWRLISWDEFQQVCVCYAGYTTRGERKAHSVVCFVKKGEKKNLYGRWKTDNPFHYRSVITIEYTDELYEEVKEKCPYEIPDLRKTRLYRL